MRRISKIGVYLGVTALFVLFVITRFWRVATIPVGVNVDEAGMAYDAWCLAFYGVDRYLQSWPLYLTNYGGGQSVLYAYLCAALFRIFDYHIVLARLPAILFSLLTLLFGMAAARKLWPGRRAPVLLTGLLITVCPYFIMAGRVGLDCNLMLGASAVFLVCFTQALQKNRTGLYVLAGVAGGILLYSYALSYVILPLFLAVMFGYALRTRQFHLKGWLWMALPLGILAFPLILVQLVNLLGLPQMQLGIFTVTRLPEYRAGEITGFCAENFRLLLKSIFVGDHLVYNSAPGFANLYGISVVFFGVGLVHISIQMIRSVRQRKFQAFAVWTAWFWSVFLMGAIRGTCVNRINGIFLCYALFAVDGMILLMDLLKSATARRIAAGSVGIAYLILFVNFGRYYYGGGYSAECYPAYFMDITVEGAVDYLESHPEIQHKGAYLTQPEIYFALSILRSPYELRLYEEGDVFFEYYDCNTLGAIDADYDYIVTNVYPEFAEELRQAGFAEVEFTGYSLFFME